MPKTAKGRKIHTAMVRQYGKAKGEKVFHASKNKGTITGVEKRKDRPMPKNMRRAAPKPGAAKSKRASSGKGGMRQAPGNPRNAGRNKSKSRRGGMRYGK